MPDVPAMPPPPDARIIPLDRQNPLTHAQVEQVRFGIGDTGPLAQAVMNANVPALAKQLTIGAVSCLSTRRPADPVVGQMIWETDTQQVRFWAGSAWVTPANATPTGSLQAFAGLAAPTGWLLCDGSAVSRTIYAGLFAVTSTTYGAGDGSTTFNLPDLRGRIVVGSGTGVGGGLSGVGLPAGGTGLTARASGAWFGDERAHAHQHSGTTGTESADHTHSFNDRAAAGWSSGVVQVIINAGSQLWGMRSNANTPDGAAVGSTYGRSATHTHSFTTDSAGLSGTQQNLQPSLVVTYIIKT
jgi:microcystin-dependent protein